MANPLRFLKSFPATFVDKDAQTRNINLATKIQKHAGMYIVRHPELGTVFFDNNMAYINHVEYTFTKVYQHETLPILIGVTESAGLSNKIIGIEVSGDNNEVFNIGSVGNGPGQYFNPSDIKIVDGVIYVCDTGNKRIIAFSVDDGEYLFTFGSDIMQMPTSIWVTTTGKIYVTDALLGKVLRYELIELVWVKTNEIVLQSIVNPANLVIRADGDILISQLFGNTGVYLFDSTWLLKGQLISSGFKAGTPTNPAYVPPPPFNIGAYTGIEPSLQQYENIQGLAASASSLIVSDVIGMTIVNVDDDVFLGEEDTVIEPLVIDPVTDMSIDGEGVYVADTTGIDIYEIDPNGGTGGDPEDPPPVEPYFDFANAIKLTYANPAGGEMNIGTQITSLGEDNDSFMSKFTADLDPENTNPREYFVFYIRSGDGTTPANWEILPRDYGGTPAPEDAGWTVDYYGTDLMVRLEFYRGYLQLNNSLLNDVHTPNIAIVKKIYP